MKKQMNLKTKVDLDLIGFNMCDKTEFVEKLNYSEWKKQFDSMQKKFKDADKHKKGDGILH